MPQPNRASTGFVAAVVAATIVIGTVIAATVIGATFIVLLTVRSAATQTGPRAAIVTVGRPVIDRSGAREFGAWFDSASALHTNGRAPR